MKNFLFPLLIYLIFLINYSYAGKIINCSNCSNNINKKQDSKIKNLRTKNYFFKFKCLRTQFIPNPKKNNEPHSTELMKVSPSILTTLEVSPEFIILFFDMGVNEVKKSFLKLNKKTFKIETNIPFSKKIENQMIKLFKHTSISEVDKLNGEYVLGNTYKTKTIGIPGLDNIPVIVESTPLKFVKYQGMLTLLIKDYFKLENIGVDGLNVISNTSRLLHVGSGQTVKSESKIKMTSSKEIGEYTTKEEQNCTLLNKESFHESFNEVAKNINFYN